MSLYEIYFSVSATESNQITKTIFNLLLQEKIFVLSIFLFLIRVPIPSSYKWFTVVLTSLGRRLYRLFVEVFRWITGLSET